MKKEKICVVLAIGFIAYSVRHSRYMPETKALPKCLKEDCGLWVPVYMLRPGHCGLIDK